MSVYVYIYMSAYVHIGKILQKEACWDFGKECTEPIDQFGDNYPLKTTEPSNRESQSTFYLCLNWVSVT